MTERDFNSLPGTTERGNREQRKECIIPSDRDRENIREMDVILRQLQ